MKFKLKYPVAFAVNLAIVMEQLNYGSTKECKTDDYQLNFRIIDVRIREVTFKWQHPRCFRVDYGIRYYEIAVTGPDGKTYRSNVGYVTQSLIKSASHQGPGIKLENLVWTPCAQYKVTLQGINRRWYKRNGVVAEVRLNFIIPLTSNDLKTVVDTVEPKYGPGWVGLVWNMGNVCYQHNFTDTRLRSFRLAISGGRPLEVSTFGFSFERDGQWDSKRSQVEFYVKNANKDCEVWCWQPCTEYSLSIRDITLDGYAYPLSTERKFQITTAIENQQQDAKVQDLALVARGSEWLMLRWKPPFCLPNNGRLYSVIHGGPPLFTCPEDVSWATFPTTENGKYYHYYNMTKCGQPLKPCTEYKVRIRGEYNNTIDRIFRTSNDLVATTLPPSVKRLEFKHTTSASVVQLSWPQVLDCSHRPILKYNVSVIAGSEPNVSVSEEIRADCGNSTVCEVNFPSSPCTKYEATVTPIYANLSEEIPPAVASFQPSFPVDVTSILNASIDNRSDSWISLRWTKPLCNRDLRISETYQITVFENANQSAICTYKTELTGITLYSGTWCENPTQQLQLQPCTEYYFEVRAQFRNADMDAKAKPTRSDVFLTLPNAHQNYVRELRVGHVESTKAVFSWQPPECAPFYKDYLLDLWDEDKSGETVSSVTVPMACVDGTNQFDWPPLLDCGIQITSRQTIEALEPCTKYTLRVWSQLEVDGSIVYRKGSKTTFATRSASPGKVSFLHLTGNSTTTLVVAWGNVEQNARCLKHYDVRVKDIAETATERPVETTNTFHTFSSLKPCSTYRVAVRSVGQPGDDVLEELQEYSTEELEPGPPQNLNYASLLHNSVTLTWDQPESDPQCAAEYLINIFQVESNNTKTFCKSLTTSDTQIEVPDLKPGTNYTFEVIARTKSELLQSRPNIFHIITLPETASQLPVTYILILVIGCVVVFLIYVFYSRAKWRISRRSELQSSDSDGQGQNLHNGNNCDKGIGRTSAALEQETPPRDSVYEYIKNRPIPSRKFGQVLLRLLADNCAVLNGEFEDVKLFSNDCEPEPVTLDGRNKAKNRYPCILPFEHSRVKLKSIGGQRDYINASFIRGFSREREYIATQNPLPGTVSDFWRMVWEQGVQLIVMLAPIEDCDKGQCAKYWPTKKAWHSSIHVSQVRESEQDTYFIRDLEVAEKDASKRLVKQMHFHKWTKFGCPESPPTFLALIKAVREQVSFLTTTAPILVHCSAGLGRTGTFIAVDWLCQAAVSQSHLDVFNTVITLRLDRMNMVQTELQYRFIHECLAQFLLALPTAEASQAKNKSCSSSNAYANLPVGYQSGKDSVKLGVPVSEYEIPNM